MKIAKIIKNEYLDSLMLMELSLEISGWPGVRQAVIIMGTESNRHILEQVGLLVGEAHNATRHDLIIAADVDAPLTVTDFLTRLGDRLSQGSRGSQGGVSYDRLDTALETWPSAHLVTISVPGEYAVELARQALEKNRHVFCFSNHVSVEDEISLKKLAVEKGLLMMGPDCGTAILDGCGLGFANRVRVGNIGLVSASGSGLQEVVSLIHRGGGGISQAIGVGGRDMRTPVNGLMTEAAVRLLGRSSQTRVIVILAKAASPEAQERVFRTAQETGLPLVVDFLSSDTSDLSRKGVVVAETFEMCARAALTFAGIPESPHTLSENVDERLADAVAHLAPGRWAVRGLFAGGSLCAEAARILLANEIVTATNMDQALSSRPSGHLLIDLGAEEYTVGRAHPFIDPRLRTLEIEQAFADSTVGILLLDVVLGLGCHPDPAGVISEALRKAREEHGPGPLIIASVCGTSDDPQNLERQQTSLSEARVFIAESNAAAARLAAHAAARIKRS
jgi:FdrA protein